MKIFILNLWKIILGNKSFTRIIGLILLIPPILSVFFFLLNVFGFGCEITQFEYLSGDWSGNLTVRYAPTYNSDAGGFAGGAGYTSSLPFYLGFMGAVGAYLIKGTDN